MSTGHAVTIRRRQRTQRAADLGVNSLLDIAGKAPGFRDELVRRAGLVQGLSEDEGAALILIVAPPGYGKSTLLADWAEQDERPFVWIALGEHEPSPLSAVGVGPSRGARGTLAQLVRRTAGRHRRFVVVLDDADRLPPAIAHDLVKGALKELPAGCAVALASRTELPLGLGRLRAHRLVREVRVEHLAMKPAEAESLIHRAGVKPGPSALQALLETTEGWPAALYLTALALRDDPDCWNELAGHHHLLSEYLWDEVLAGLPAELEQFALDTSVLEGLSGAICDTVLEQQGSAALIGELAARTPLLIPLDPAHHRYRWHTLMRQALSAELLRTGPERARVLRLRAGRWYAERGDTVGAIGQMAAAGDAEFAGSLMWREILAYLTTGRNALVRGWLSSFSPTQIAENTPLALSASVSALVDGSVGDAEHWALVAGAAIERDGAGRERQPLTAALALIEALTSGEGMAHVPSAATTTLASLPKDSLWRPVCLLLAGVGLYLRGERTGAARVLDEGTRLSGNRAPLLTAICLAQRATIELEQEGWELAAELLDRSLAVLEEWHLTDDPLSAVVFGAAAASCAHQGRIDEAKRHMRSGRELLAELGDFVPWYGAETRILLARASLSLADTVAARTLLAEASRLARRVSDAVVFSESFDRAWARLDTLAETSLAGPSSLTIAELRILRFLPSHRSFKEIADQLGVSANTVKTQAHAVYRKLGVASRSEAVSHAVDAGLLLH